MNILFGSTITDDTRRRELYQGSLVLHAQIQSALTLCKFAQEMIEDAFGNRNPLKVHETTEVEKCVEILSVLKPNFIHHPQAKECIQKMLLEVGCDLTATYFDVPRMRTAFPGDYLKSGIAYAFHPHRDTWYSAPFCQINWWMPIYEINTDNCMAIHPHYWDRPVRNSSHQYNYYRWNQENRKNAAQHIRADTRIQPKPEEPMELDPQIRLVCDVGGAYQFSAAQMHSTVPNSSAVVRYSIDFRTIHLDDVKSRIGAPNVDSACTGTTMRDYLRGTDLSHLPDEAIALYDDGTLVAI